MTSAAVAPATSTRVAPGAAFVVRTVRVDESAPLLDLLPAPDALAWVRDGEGLVGWGAAARLDVAGHDRFAAADAWFARWCAAAEVADQVGLPGTGPIAFASFGFADEPGSSVVVVPRVVVGRRGGTTWVTTVDADPRLRRPSAVLPPGAVTWAHGALDAAAWMAAVEQVVARIATGEAAKVVLARDLIAEASRPVDPRHLLRRLAAGYPGCWTFAVDGLVGATPELLLRLRDADVTSRVLAGTVRRTGTGGADEAALERLLASSKDLEEHEYAVESVARSLEPFCESLDVPRSPAVLSLANVLHLATDVRARLVSPRRSLEIVAALHPTAAVGGTPREAALRVIAEVEGMDRGRYAGPVGWLDANGDGEWGIALRCAQVEGTRVRAFAGCGLVAGSDPAAEYAETQDKLVPIREALESR